MTFEKYKARALSFKNAGEMLRFMQETKEHKPDSEIYARFNNLAKSQAPPLGEEGEHIEVSKKL